MCNDRYDTTYIGAVKYKQTNVLILYFNMEQAALAPLVNPEPKANQCAVYSP